MESATPQPPQRNGSPANRNRDRNVYESSSRDAQLPPSSSTPSMTSEDSQTVLLDGPKKESDPASAETTSRPSMPSRSSTFGVKKCWICIGDSTEDDPTDPPVWRSPCTCNLTAHEACLLDWVADLENPKNRRRNPPPTKILCPQCKSEIKIARPNNYIVSAVKHLDRGLGRLVLPGLGLSTLGMVYAGLSIHGFYSVLLVCGRAHAIQIFEEAQNHRGWLSGYCLIPLSLIFSRTQYADFVLPGGTLFLLATQLSEKFEIDITIWPPLPSTVFACLPALRTGYNFAYEKLFGELNRKWIQEVQPRQMERVDGQEGNLADMANDEELAMEEAEDGGLVVQLEVNIGPQVEDDIPPENQAGQDQANADDHQQAGEGGQEGQQAQAEGAAAANQNPNQILGQNQDQIIDASSGVGQTILGALIFPGVAAGMGGLLSYAIPASWMTSANWMNGRPGLLRHRWGRSVVGGCMFVVLKDALVLYCRWKLAQTHRQRKIMDYDKVAKKYTLPGRR